MDKSFKIIALAVIFVIISTSCAFTDELYNGEKIPENVGSNRISYDVMDKGPEKGGTLRLFSTIPDTLNPITTKNKYVQNFCSLIYEGLFKLEKDQGTSPVLVKEWNISDDSLVWTFKLRQDVYWHDGTLFTAEDVEYTIEAILKNEVDTVYKKNLQNIITFVATDRFTLKVSLRKPNSFFAELMTFPIMPKRYSSVFSAGNDQDSFKPIGTGPFMFSYRDKDRSVVLAANENWWNTESENASGIDLPYISNIELRFYKSTKDEMAAFQAGEIDVTFIEDTDYDRYSGRSDLIIKKFAGRSFDFIALNNKNPALSEKAVRQAISYFIDKAALINEFLIGKAVAADIPVHPTSWIYDAGSNSPRHNRGDAAEILKKNGWQEDKEGIYKRINGVKTYLKFELLVNEGNDLRLKIADRIKEQLGKNGIRVDVVQLKWEEILKKAGTGKYDLILTGCRTPLIPDISYLYASPYLSNYSGNSEDSAWNISAYYNPEAADYINRVFSENNRGMKKAIFFNMVEMLNEDVPYIGLFFYNNAILYNRNIRGDIDPYVWNKLNDIMEWYIPAR